MRPIPVRFRDDELLLEFVEQARPGWAGPYDPAGFLWQWIKSGQVRIEPQPHIDEPRDDEPEAVENHS